VRDVLYAAASALGRSLELATLHRLGRGIGSFIWHFVPGRADIATEAVERHLGLGRAAARTIARASFGQSGCSFLEALVTHRVDHRFVAERIAFPERGLMEDLKRERRPIIYATGHLGAWELQPCIMNLYFSDRPCLVVVRRPKDLALHRTITHLRVRPHVAIIDHRRAVFPIQRTLKKGGIAAFLVDHNTSRDEATFLPFLGQLAAVNAGPALMAVRAGALVVPTAMIRMEQGTYVQHFGEPLDTATLTGSREDKVRETALFYTRAIEEYVRRYPEQWFWMHRRWKTRPTDEEQPKEPKKRRRLF
jgi:KDO2-lipid IV(A) lauroyltransferase